MGADRVERPLATNRNSSIAEFQDAAASFMMIARSGTFWILEFGSNAIATTEVQQPIKDVSTLATSSRLPKI